jgi:SAM-dependent methyltransferase
VSRYRVKLPQIGEIVPLTPGETNDARIAPYWRDGILDFDSTENNAATADHYSLQWGPKVNFQQFSRANNEAMDITPGRQMGWPDLFARIREAARHREVKVYDAACGFGAIMDELFRAPVPEGLSYVGADIHASLPHVRRPDGVDPSRILFVRWDISEPLPLEDRFDVVICRAAIHHTPRPEHTFAGLVKAVADDGVLAISAYARKGRLRESIDDALRAQVARLSSEDAFLIASEFSALGRALQGVKEKVTVTEEMPWLGIKAGTYGLQELIYDHVLKCWYNEQFGDYYSNVVNFDWYHPPYAYRYEVATLRGWFEEAGFTVATAISTKPQHFLEGQRGGGLAI